MTSVTILKLAALAFSVLALTAGVLQLVAYASGGWIRHAVVGVFACAVGISVGAAVIAALIRDRR